jgi:homocysteine S-methyltransferase
MVDANEVDQWPDLVIYPDATNGEVYNATTQQWEKGGEESNSVYSAYTHA